MFNEDEWVIVEFPPKKPVWDEFQNEGLSPKEVLILTNCRKNPVDFAKYYSTIRPRLHDKTVSDLVLKDCSEYASNDKNKGNEHSQSSLNCGSGKEKSKTSVAGKEGKQNTAVPKDCSEYVKKGKNKDTRHGKPSPKGDYRKVKSKMNVIVKEGKQNATKDTNGTKEIKKAHQPKVQCAKNPAAKCTGDIDENKMELNIKKKTSSIQRMKNNVNIPRIFRRKKNGRLGESNEKLPKQIKSASFITQKSNVANTKTRNEKRRSNPFTVFYRSIFHAKNNPKEKNFVNTVSANKKPKENDRKIERTGDLNHPKIVPEVSGVSKSQNKLQNITAPKALARRALKKQRLQNPKQQSILRFTQKNFPPIKIPCSISKSYTWRYMRRYEAKLAEEMKRKFANSNAAKLGRLFEDGEFLLKWVYLHGETEQLKKACDDKASGELMKEANVRSMESGDKDSLAGGLYGKHWLIRVYNDVHF